MKVLITSPSLTEAKNVSGVSSVVKAVVDENSKSQECVDFIKFVVGREDGRSNTIKWLLNQAILPFRLALKIFITRPKIAHINGPLDYLAAVRDLLIILVSRALFLNVIYHVHGGPYLHTVAPSVLVKYSIKLNFLLANRIIVLGKSEESAIENIYKADIRKISVMPNAISVQERLLPRKSSNQLNILFMGRFVESKGIAVLVQALIDLHKTDCNFTVSVYGAGPLEGYIIERLKAAIDDKFYFGGIATSESKGLIFNQADVLALPSLWGEGLPMVILEAMSFGVPVVATNDGSIADLVEDGVSGLLIPKNDVEALCDSFKKIIFLKSSGDYDSMRDYAHKAVLKNYDIEKYVKSLRTLYINLQ